MSTYVYVYLSISISMPMPMSMSTHVYVYLCLYLPLSLSTYLYVYLSLCQPMSMSMSIYLYVYLCLNLPISMSTFVYVYPCLCLYRGNPTHNEEDLPDTGVSVVTPTKQQLYSMSQCEIKVPLPISRFKPPQLLNISNVMAIGNQFVLKSARTKHSLSCGSALGRHLYINLREGSERSRLL